MYEAINDAAKEYIGSGGEFCPFCKEPEPEVMSGLKIDGSIVTRKLLA